MAPRLELERTRSEAGEVLRFGGSLRRGVVRELDAALTAARPAAGGRLLLDLSRVDGMDSAGVAALLRGWRMAQEGGAELVIAEMSEPVRRALQMFRLAPDLPVAPLPTGFVEGLGVGVLDARTAMTSFTQLAADATFAVGSAVIRLRTMRWRALFDQCTYIGSQALPIVGLISFLVGLTLAFQSAHQLQQFGAAIYTADLIAVSVLREMGPLMTAILVAGRSGSSIAAEVATMKVSEEIDGLKVMGIDPVSFLAVPRLLAISMMVPLLTMLANVLGILGGFLVGIFYLDIAWNAFLTQIINAVAPWDLFTGLFKSLCFAWGIGLIGLFYGFRVSGGAGEVGRTTTASVVAAIFYIIVADCLFSVLFYVIL